MKINFVISTTNKSGGVRAIFEVANGLAKRGYKVRIISLGTPEHHWFPLREDVDLIYPESRYFVSANSIFSKLSRALKLPYEIDKIKFLARVIPQADINVATFHPTAYSVFLMGKGRLFYYIQHYETFTCKDDIIESRVAEGSYYLPLRHLVVSRWLSDLIEKKTGQRPAYVGNGVNTGMFYPVTELRKKNTVMSFIRGIPWKGDEDTLRAFQIVQERIKEVKYKIIGNRKTVNELMKKANVQLDSEVIENPPDNEIAALYSSITVFVFASHLEGFGLPPLEAMACATPVVTTDCLGVRDYVVDGCNGLVVPPKKPEILAETIIKVLSDSGLRDKLRRNSLLTAKKLSWDKVVDRFEKEFTKREQEQ